MIRHTDSILDEFDRPVAGAQVYVYNLDGSLATLTVDGTVPLTQPVLSDEFGIYTYYANTAYYNEDIWYGAKKRWRNANVPVGNPGADLALRADLAASSGSSLVSFLRSAAGAVVRTLNNVLSTAVPVIPADFGAVGDGVADDTTKLQAFWDYVIANNVPHDCSGNYAISSGLIIGPSSAPSPAPTRSPLTGRMRLKALSPMNEMVRLRNLGYQNAEGLSLDLTGTGALTFASRTCLIAVFAENCQRMRLGQLKLKAFALAGLWAGASSTNTLMQVGSIVADSIGSGRASQSLTANWSAPANSGSSGSTGQSTQITVDALPSATIQAYETIGTGQLQVRIAGYLYYVNSIVGSNVTIYPWLDNTSFGTGTGTLEWVFGGAFCTRGTDSNLIEVGALDVSNSSRTLSEAALYGSKIRDMQSNTVGTEICLGKAVASACAGTKVFSRYVEGSGSAPHEQIAAINGFGASNYAEILGDSGAPDLSKCWGLGSPRATAGQIVGGEFGATISGAGAMVLSKSGRLLQFHKTNLNNLPGSSFNVRGQSREPRIVVYRKDTVTFLLSVEGAGEYNRLFGYSGGTTLVFGTGTNGAPTGNVVFTPPSGGTINGGSVDATATFSGFDGPALFSYEHTDTAQLTWLVRPITGQSRANLAALGYTTGAGGAVTQLTSRTTSAPQINKLCGQITLFSAAGTATWQTFTVPNATVAATDVIRVNQASGTDKYMIHVTKIVAATSFDITFATTGGTTTEQPVFNFAVIKAVAA